MIASWLKVLKADEWAVFTAASEAQQAADYIVRESERTAQVAA
jgi:antirestriction protein ArdC